MTTIMMEQIFYCFELLKSIVHDWIVLLSTAFTHFKLMNILSNWFKYDLDKSSMHPNFDLTGV